MPSQVVFGSFEESGSVVAAQDMSTRSGSFEPPPPSDPYLAPEFRDGPEAAGVMNSRLDQYACGALAHYILSRGRDPGPALLREGPDGCSLADLAAAVQRFDRAMEDGPDDSLGRDLVRRLMTYQPDVYRWWQRR
jgi:hypothetical protein